MLNISFDFDETTHKVSHLIVTEIDKNQETKPIITDNYNYDLKILDSSIQFTSEATEKLGIKIGDRISINYWYSGPNIVVPLISKSGILDESDSGNMLKKSKTISFRGEQRDWLLKYGTIFLLEKWMDKAGKVKDGVFKLIPVKEDDSSEDKIVAIAEAAVEDLDQKIEDDADWLFEI